MTALLRAHFREIVISRVFPTARLSRSSNLNPCDLWLWIFLKDRVYRGNIQTIPELKARITRHVTSIATETLRSTVGQAVTQFERVIDVNGMHIVQVCD